MAKTKRRSCKGGRRSRRCRGGVPKRAYTDPYYADGKGRTPQGVSLFGDTKKPKQVLQIGPTHADINAIQRGSNIYMATRPIRIFARGVSASAKNTANRFKESVLGLPGRTASALRGSVSGIYKRLTTDPRFEKEKLIPANIETKHNQDGAQNFLKRSNEIYDSNYNKVGQYYDNHPYFLPGHYKPDETWNIAEWDPTPKWGGR